MEDKHDETVSQCQRERKNVKKLGESESEKRKWKKRSE